MLDTFGIITYRAIYTDIKLFIKIYINILNPISKKPVTFQDNNISFKLDKSVQIYLSMICSSFKNILT